MFTRICGLLLIHLASFSTVAISGQTLPTPLPYTAEFRVTHTDLPGNGNTVTEEATIIKARDSQGRLMWSRIAVPLSNTEAPVAQIIVTDLGAHNYSAWNIPGHEVIVQELSSYESLAKRCIGKSTEVPYVPHDGRKSFDLGIRTIAGVKARGGKTIVSSTKAGGTSVLVRSQEVWMAIVPGLEGFAPLTVVETPADGETTQELVRFDQSEPYPTLFQPPAEYAVIHRTADEAPCSPDPTPVPIASSSTQPPSKPR
jgi:hypothetical protein